MSALALADVHVDLGGRPVLTGVDLHVDPGELVALLGPNGAGKTTLLRTALGLVRPGCGVVSVDGHPVDRRSSRRIGYVPQRHEFAWSFPISVHDAVLSGRTPLLRPLQRPGSDDYAATAQALDRVRMSALADRPVGELSGGQRQRVLVARALATRPRVLLLDEPFTGLDLPSQEMLTDLFTTLAHDGEAILMTTHDLASALASSDRVYLLRGRVVATGRPADLDDPAVWMDVFGVGPTSPLLTAVCAR